ncbi:Flagellar L-ring protein [Gammaproteobacteria bacterium]
MSSKSYWSVTINGQTPRHVQIMFVLSVVLLGGCAAGGLPRDPRFAPVYPEPPANTSRVGMNIGAIYQAGGAIMLFQDNRAHRVGDTLTIILTETTNASKSANTSADKSNKTSITNPTILGRAVDAYAPKGLPLAAGNLNLGFDLGSEQSFAGKGASQQSNKLSGSVTVTVAEVLANGNLMVRGEKWLALNQGEEYVRLSGIVRPTDIFPDNTIPSTKVADARIEYGGTGAVADSNVLGWLSRFFLSGLWPF